MAQTLAVVVLFLGAVAALPWLVRHLQQRNAGAAAGAGLTSKVVSAVAVGQHQRVVTIEVGPEDSRTWLVLGITAQQINCLYIFPTTPTVAVVPTLPTAKSESSTADSGANFAQLMEATVKPDMQGKEGYHA